MQPLNLVAVTDLTVGDRIWSHRTGAGSITKVIPHEQQFQWKIYAHLDSGSDLIDEYIYNLSGFFYVGHADAVLDTNLITLSDVPWDSIKVGDKLISAQGKPGTVVAKELKDPNRTDSDNYFIKCEWEGVSTPSYAAHYVLDTVLYLKSENGYTGS
jgi:hypothetical protein